jgi:hypothetical protein
MRGINSGVMTVLAGIIAVIEGTTATAQAQEINHHRSTFMAAMPTLCIDLPSGNTTCLSNNKALRAMTHDNFLPRNRLWRSNQFSQQDTYIATSLFSLQDRTCDNWQNPARSPMMAEYPDPISLTRYLTVDFEMDNINRFELSSLFLGFRDCW